ncbi:MAG: DUF3450 domain-containing protein [Gammaproteobacteria bacterium]|nr:DUF3450 domain-containing protein [Gammaproteobacteria bacterium]
MKDMKYTLNLILLLLIILSGKILAAADPLESAVQDTVEANEEARQSQHHIDALADETKDLVQEYKTTLEKIDSLKSYNEQLEILTEKQEETLKSIFRQLGNAEETQRNIIPLMLRMIETLQEFIALDMPFLRKERQTRLETIKEMMDQPDISMPEKYRRIMEAYQIEMEYGRSIETGSDTIFYNDKNNTVDVLRIGRIALLYQTLDGRESGYWDKKEKAWKKLTDNYNQAIKQGILIARKQSSPDLFIIPVEAPVQTR